MPKRFWDWYDARVHELELNDNKVALLAGISNSVVSKARGGLQPIGHEALAKIAPVLRVSVATAYALAGYIETEEALSPEKSALIEMFDELSENDREEVLAIISVRAKRGKRLEKKKA